ncbi:LytTR family transcriptional regulator DNA-binding domain-containing protein [Catenovulum sp. SM1970]|nr:LytTR family transcriptional regulator DNA-binding domain-containing protein [Marinifaba aquimaris]
MRLVLGLLFVFLSFVGQAKEKWVIGYFHFWVIYNYNYHIHDVEAQRLTHLIYKCIKPGKGGTVEMCDVQTDIKFNYPDHTISGDRLNGSYGQMLKLKKQHPHLKNIISLGGWGNSTYFSAIAADATVRQYFINNLIEHIDKYQFDGIEVDWRYPVYGGDPGNPNHPDDANNLSLLITELRQALDQLETKRKKKYWLSLVSAFVEEYSGIWHPKQISEHLDFVSITSSFMYGAWSKEAQHQAPLGINPNLPTPENTIEAGVAWLKQKGLPADKIVMSIPSHIHAWQGVEYGENKGLYQPWQYLPDSSRNDINGKPSGLFSYSQVLELLEQEGSELIWDEYTKGHYVYNHQHKLFVTFESHQSALAKLHYADQQGFAGVALSELSSDVKSAESLQFLLFEHYYPTKAFILDLKSLLIEYQKLLLGIFVGILIIIVGMFWRLNQLKQQKLADAELEKHRGIKSELFNHLAIVGLIAEQLCVLFERSSRAILPKLYYDSQLKLLKLQNDQLFLLSLSQNINAEELTTTEMKLRNRSVCLNALVMSLDKDYLSALPSDSLVFVKSDIRALIFLLRIMLKQGEFKVKLAADKCHLTALCCMDAMLQLSKIAQKWKQAFQVNEGYFILELTLEPQSQQIVYLEHLESKLNDQKRLSILQKLQQQALVTGDIDLKLESVLSHLTDDTIIKSVSEEPKIVKEPNYLVQNNNLSLQFVLNDEPSEQDKSFFDCVANLIDISRQSVMHLAQQPQVLSELYEISSRKEHIYFVKADEGYSGIYYKKTGNPKYIMMRLKTIKNYFDDESLVQVHRSWLVNPNKVKSVRRRHKRSYSLDLGIEEIPIGRSYVDSLSSRYPEWFDSLKPNF